MSLYAQAFIWRGLKWLIPVRYAWIYQQASFFLNFSWVMPSKAVIFILLSCAWLNSYIKVNKQHHYVISWYSLESLIQLLVRGHLAFFLAFSVGHSSWYFMCSATPTVILSFIILSETHSGYPFSTRASSFFTMRATLLFCPLPPSRIGNRSLSLSGPIWPSLAWVLAQTDPLSPQSLVADLVSRWD